MSVLSMVLMGTTVLFFLLYWRGVKERNQLLHYIVVILINDDLRDIVKADTSYWLKHQQDPDNHKTLFQLHSLLNKKVQGMSKRGSNYTLAIDAVDKGRQ